MRVAICEGPGRIGVHVRPPPDLGADRVRVRIALCGICGSDVAAWQGRGHATYPCSPGHEFCGQVKETGRDVRGLRVGQRVVINPNLGCGGCRFCREGRPNLCDFLKGRPIKSNGGLSDEVALDYRMVSVLPDELGDELAVFVEPLSCALHAAERLSVGRGETVAVFGAGVMGLLTCLALKACDAVVVFVEPSDVRRLCGPDWLGAPAWTPEEFARSSVYGALDGAVDCSGSPGALRQAVKALRKGGSIVLSGLPAVSEETPVPLGEVTTRELAVRGAWLNPNSFSAALELAVSQSRFLARLTTQSFPLERIADAMAVAAGGTVHKVLVRP